MRPPRIDWVGVGLLAMAAGSAALAIWMAWTGAGPFGN